VKAKDEIFTKNGIIKVAGKLNLNNLFFCFMRFFTFLAPTVRNFSCVYDEIDIVI
jgi:hypothetical protein